MLPTSTSPVAVSKLLTVALFLGSFAPLADAQHGEDDGEPGLAIPLPAGATPCQLPRHGSIRAAMKKFMLTRLKWTHRELHDALVTAGLDIPSRPSVVNYFNTLRLQFGDNQLGFLPQSIKFKFVL